MSVNCSCGLTLSNDDALGSRLSRETQNSTQNASSNLVMTKGRLVECARTLSLTVFIMFSTTGTCWPGPAVSTINPCLVCSSSFNFPIAPSPSVRIVTVSNHRLLAIERKDASPAPTSCAVRFDNRRTTASPKKKQTMMRKKEEAFLFITFLV